MTKHKEVTPVKFWLAVLAALFGQAATVTYVATQDEPRSFVAQSTPKTPGDVIDTSFWKLTLPTGQAGKPTEIKYPALRSYENGAYFYDQRKPGEAQSYVVFIAHAGGTTTSGSKYPRSELREMSNDGKSLAAWSNKDSTVDTLSGTWAITQTPTKKPHVVAAQIHDAKDDIVMLRLEKTRLFLEANGKDLGAFDTKYVASVNSPIWFDFTIRADKTNGIVATYKRHDTSGCVEGCNTNGCKPNGFTKSIKYKKFGSGWYFKAGAYTQSNRSYDKASAYGAVRIKGLIVTHK